jgi:signal transduction histidine kinase/DNA-binding LacI/PurR family transcriptional regulator/AraC-like DNA-binding protein/DNA-binding LytR/AlgR family response regulator
VGLLRAKRAQQAHKQKRRTMAPRPTIGLIGALTPDRLTLHLWSGVDEVARERDVNLIFVPAHALDAPIRFDAQANVLYDLVGDENVDGLVVWGGAMAAFAGAEAVRACCERYRSLPMVSAALPLEGVPSVLVDNRQGVRDVVGHLIEVHGCRRIAFVGPRGHPEADERYRGYADALEEHGLPLDPGLVAPGAFNVLGRASGTEAVRLLLDERGRTFDALVAATDIIAVGAMEALQARGIQMPRAPLPSNRAANARRGVAVVGFDDLPEAEAAAPPVTTVSFGAHRLGRCAAETLLAHMAGERVDERLVLPLEIVVRQSCGCLPREVVRAAAEPVTAPGGGPDPDRAGQLVDALLEELGGKAGALVAALEDLLRRVPAAEFDAAAWQDALSALRGALSPGDGKPPTLPGDVWQQARVMIGSEAERAWMERTLQAEQLAARTRETGEALITTFDLAELTDILVRELPGLDIPSAYLSLYEEPKAPAGWARLVVGYDENGRIEVEGKGRRFPSRQLVPEGLLPTGRRYSLVVEPLYSKEEQLGFALLEAGPPQINVCSALRGQLSSALKGALLFERSAELYQEALDARAAAEEADQLKTRLLASVSHELRTPLSLIVGLAEMLLGERPQDTPLASEEHRQDLERIHASAEHLDGLLSDVLDLARSEVGQLQLVCEPLDLADVLAPVTAVGEQMAEAKGLAWHVVVPERLPQVWGDRARLRQVVLNLVSNAIKFTAQGEVALSVEAREITDFGLGTADGEWQIANGESQMIVVSVTDTGLGIPPGEQETIFDEFRRSERAAARGYGGLGLGLAICKRLVELHGGEIGVRSSGDEGEGSTFFLTLPVVDETVSGQAAPTARAQTVLLLAEMAGEGERLREYLARQGFEVEEYPLEEQADWPSQVLAAPPGAVVLDLETASARGWEVLRVLKGHPVTQDVPVLFYSLKQDGGALLEMDYMTKPVGTAELAQALERQGLLAHRTEKKKTILVVDDEPTVLEMHARVVQAQLPACRVIEARNGREALEAIRREQPALVLLDLVMPELDGFGVLEAMREEKATRDVPVIVLTGQVLTEQDMDRLNRGVAAVLGKGLFSAEETLAHVEQALSRSRRLGSEIRRIVRKAMAYVHERYAGPISREEIARYVGVSPRHLDRCFRQETGMTPVAYRNRYRVRQAKALLEKGLKVTDVALEVGFGDSSNFARTFRREVGISPSAYRRGEESS